MIRTFVRRTALAALVVLTPQMALPDSLSGAYLAGRQAALQNDFVASAQYYTAALARDPSNISLMEDTIATQLAIGNLTVPCRSRGCWSRRVFAAKRPI